MPLRVDEDTLNMRLVHEGVRPACMIPARSRRGDLAFVKAKARAAKLDVAFHSVEVMDEPRVLAHMVMPRGAPKPPKRQTHRGIASLLGLPCAARQAWMEPQHCHQFVALAVDKRACKDMSDVVPAVYITSFWCSDKKAGVIWCKRFKKKAAAFERQHLAPLGYKLLFRLASPLIL